MESSELGGGRDMVRQLLECGCPLPLFGMASSELSKTSSRVEKLARIEFPLSPSFVVNFVVNFL
jgi:hypothetical protein